MKAATTSQRFFEQTKLLVFSAQAQIQSAQAQIQSAQAQVQTSSKQATIHHGHLADLPAQLKAGDLLVVNRSATLPASFRGKVARSGAEVEIRLAAFQGPSPQDLSRWQAISFGAGDWRTPTEMRGPAPHLQSSDRIDIGPELYAEVEKVEQKRVLKLRFGSAQALTQPLLPLLYQYGRPIQYAYHQAPLEIWDQQTIFSGPPISVEPPSAGFAFSWDLLFALRAQGVKIVSLLHSAGLSSTGDPALDTLLPLSEWYQIPAETVAAIQTARAQRQRVVALGTTVLRALESAAQSGELQSGEGLSELKIRPGYRFKVVNALITGMHEPGSSHMRILDALFPLPVIEQGYREAEDRGYRGHEYGDLSFLDCQACA
ncbi:MAG: S-adenosylmethionine:tRNA ribosyltransferase-isomerase [Candidatus Sericytochromatia bacterium]|nr:S-adenosylmethionine:tRNA ribosyltransferase-isomerase [Candidatus Sericytochromatia bacterium]